MESIEDLMAMEEIKILRHRYCSLLDQRRWDDVIELFMDDATADLGALGKFSNRDALLAFFKEEIASGFIFAAHMMHNPIIRVKGDEAEGDWYLTCHATSADNEAVLMFALTHDEYRRVDGVWKFKTIQYEFKYITPYERGWGKMPFPPPDNG